MRTSRSRSLAAIAAGALMLAPLAGCGSDNKTKDASGTTSSASSSPSVSGAAAPGDRLTKDNLVATMVAAMRAKKTAHMVMQLGSSMEATADLRYSETTTDMKMSMTMGATQAQVILVDGVMYMQQGAGGKYLKIDKSDPAMGNLLKQMSGLGPEASVAAMKDGLQAVEYAGSDTIDGAKVSKYHVTVDTAAVAKSLGASSADTSSLPKTVTYDLFVDGENLMRRVDMTVSGQRVLMNVSKWGEPVDIKAPAASEIQSK